MICPRCHGTGRTLVRSAAGKHRVRPAAIEICAECRGVGILHCCEGERAQVPSKVVGEKDDDR